MVNCSHCGTVNTPDAGYCVKCGQPLPAAASVVAAAAAGAPRPAGGAQTNSLAVASLLVGLLALAPPCAILAVVFGHIARSQIRKSEGRMKGGGLALAGLILGYLGLGFVLFVILVVIPSLSWH